MVSICSGDGFKHAAETVCFWFYLQVGLLFCSVFSPEVNLKHVKLCISTRTVCARLLIL